MEYYGVCYSVYLYVPGRVGLRFILVVQGGANSKYRCPAIRTEISTRRKLGLESIQEDFSPEL